MKLYNYDSELRFQLRLQAENVFRETFNNPPNNPIWLQ